MTTYMQRDGRITSAATDDMPERIWLDADSYNGAVGFAHPEKHKKDGWPVYIRGDLAAAHAEIERLTARAEKAEAERDSQEADFAKSIAIEVAARLKAEAERDDALAEIERLKPMVIDWDGVRAIMDSDDVIWVHGDDYASAVKERDEARAQVAAAFEAAAKSLIGRFAELDGDNIRALTPSNAKAALEAYGRKKMREGMQRVIDRLRHEGQINPSLTYADAIEWAEYILAEMEKDADQ